MSLQPILIKLGWVNFQKSMRHEGSNERASENVRRGGCAIHFCDVFGSILKENNNLPALVVSAARYLHVRVAIHGNSACTVSNPYMAGYLLGRFDSDDASVRILILLADLVEDGSTH